MSSEVQARVEALQDQLAAAMAEQEVEDARVPGEQATRAGESGRGTSSQDEGQEALRARGADLVESLEKGGGRPAIGGAP